MPFRSRLASAGFMVAVAGASLARASVHASIGAACLILAVWDVACLLVTPIRAAGRFCSELIDRAVAASLAVLAMLALCVLMTNQASAAAASAVDVQPFLASIIETAIYVTGPPIGLALFGLVLRLYQLVGVKRSATSDAAIRATIDQVMGHAANYARAKVGAIGAVPVEVKSEALAHFAEYALQAAPGALKKLGIADKASKRLEAMAEARLGVPAFLAVSPA